MSLTTYGRQHVGDHVIGKSSWTMPTLYAGLYALDPTVAGSHASELTFAGYARVSVTAKLGATDSSGISTNTIEFNFGTPVASDNPAAFIGYSDALSAGNMILVEAIPNPRPVIAGVPVRIKVGKATIRAI